MKAHRGGKNDLSEVKGGHRSFISKQNEMMEEFASSPPSYVTLWLKQYLLSFSWFLYCRAFQPYWDERVGEVHSTDALSPWSGQGSLVTLPQWAIKYYHFLYKLLCENGKHAWMQCACPSESLARPPLNLVRSSRAFSYSSWDLPHHRCILHLVGVHSSLGCRFASLAHHCVSSTRLCSWHMGRAQLNVS